jgi:integrase/recombinase XerC
VRLREKDSKRHAMPCHHNLDEYLVAYLDGASLRDDPVASHAIGIAPFR